jgi:predicted RNA-binding protein (TIGR00451 family)
MGAVRHICNGANVTAPGIVRFEGSFRKGDLVFVVDEKYGKPIAIGEILYDDAEAVQASSKALWLRMCTFVGDRIWSALKEVA